MDELDKSVEHGRHSTFVSSSPMISREAMTRALLENHLAFLDAHRGTVTRRSKLAWVTSDNADFNYAILLRGTRAASARRMLERFGSVHLLGDSPRLEALVNAGGFQRTGGLSYMVLDGDPRGEPNPRLAIETASDEAGMATFSDVQLRGFIQNAEVQAKWQPWLLAANLRNLARADQSFFIGRIDGRPAGVLLLVTHGATAGIYAVATLPEFRKQGVSTTLLAHAVRLAREQGRSIVTLQVARGSDAERLYLHQGFREAIGCRVFRKAVTP